MSILFNKNIINIIIKELKLQKLFEDKSDEYIINHLNSFRFKFIYNLNTIVKFDENIWSEILKYLEIPDILFKLYVKNEEKIVQTLIKIEDELSKNTMITWYINDDYCFHIFTPGFTLEGYKLLIHIHTRTYNDFFEYYFYKNMKKAYWNKYKIQYVLTSTENQYQQNESKEIQNLDEEFPIDYDPFTFTYKSKYFIELIDNTCFIDIPKTISVDRYINFPDMAGSF